VPSRRVWISCRGLASVRRTSMQFRAPSSY